MSIEEKDGVQVIAAASSSEWRTWLTENHCHKKSVWLIIYKKESRIPSVYYPEAVDEALCFGWVDSKPNKRDEVSYYQFFSKRNPKSNWSKINKEKVGRLISLGKMAKAGLQMVDHAKKTGTWDALNQVEQLIIPKDLQLALEGYKKSLENFKKFPPSVQRGILEWILNAKKEETRMKRIRETSKLAEQNIRANQYKK